MLQPLQRADKVLEALPAGFKLPIFRDAKYHEKSRFARHTPVKTGFFLAAALLSFAAFLIGSMKADALKGTWGVDEITVYQFDGRGNDALVLPDSQFLFNYKISEDALHIDFKSENARDFDYVFTVDGDRLSLSGGEGANSITHILTRLEQ